MKLRLLFFLTGLISGFAFSCTSADSPNAHPPLEGIQHMVIFDLKHEKNSPEARKFMEDGKRILSAIPSVQKFQAYDQVSPKNDFTYGFSMIFKDQAGYESYNKHPDHVDFVENRWKPEVTRFLEIDFEDFGR